MRLNNRKGFVLPLTILVVVVLVVLGSVFVLRTINEWVTVDRQRRMEQAFYLAEGGAHAALDRLDTLINHYLLDTVTASNPQVVINVTQSYVANGDGLGFLALAVRDNNVQQLTIDGEEAYHSLGPVSLGSGIYQFDIKISEKGDPLSVGLDQWDFPYYYQIESRGAVGSTERKVSLAGDFTVRVQRDNFAKYALFTNRQTLPNGTKVWFTDKTNFAGPVQTNDRFNFALNPSGTFDGTINQEEQTARFYNNGWPILLDAEANGSRDIPIFNAEFNRGEDEIVLSSSVERQDMVDQATGGASFSGNGIFVPNDGLELTGGIYVNGDAGVEVGIDGNNNAVYTIAQSGVTKIVTVDDSLGQTTIETVGVGVETFDGVPDGTDDVGTIMFINGNVTSLGGTVQEDTELTISSENDIMITDNLVYSDYSPATGSVSGGNYVPPDAHGTNNLLGLVSWQGDVRIATSAPDDVNVHGTILAKEGIFRVDGYNDQGVGSRGTATLLGGVITDYYGAFGLFNGYTGQQVSGYGRNFVYDERMLGGKSPPYFPSLKTFIAFTNDIIDKLILQEGDF